MYTHKVRRFWWDRRNVDHLARHRVRPEEAEQAYNDPLAVPVAAYPGPDGWPREAQVGVTQGGRLLVVVWETRPDAGEPGGAGPDAEDWAVVVTAYDPAPQQRRRYGQRSGGPRR